MPDGVAVIRLRRTGTSDFGKAKTLGPQPKAGPPLAENPSPLCFFVYVLYSLSYKNRYVGSAEKLDIRFKQHNAGKVRYTKGRSHWVIIYKESFPTRTEARKRELFLKSGQGRNFLDNLL